MTLSVWGACRAAALSALVAGAGSACAGQGAGTAAPEELQGRAEREAEVVAEVGAQAIGVDEVSDLAAATGLSAREAAERLVVERLLAAEAHRRGYGEGADRALRGAAVHALLQAEVESVESEDTLPTDVVEPRLAQAMERHTVPPRRRADHVLFRAEAKASDAKRTLAMEGAQQALAALTAGDVDEVLDHYRAMKRYEGEVPVLVEQLPAVAREAGMEAPFLDALFAAKEPGPLGEVVETRYGFHAVVLRELLPEEVPARDELEPKVRHNILVERRRAAFDALVERLRTQTAIEYFDDAIAEALADAPQGAP